MKNCSVALLFGVVFLFLGCDVAKTHRKDGCPYCRSAFSTNIQTTEIRLQDGSPVAKFDNIGCALRFTAMHPEFTGSEIYVQDKNNNIFSKAEELRYPPVSGKLSCKLNNQMGCGIG